MVSRWLADLLHASVCAGDRRRHVLLAVGRERRWQRGAPVHPQRRHPVGRRAVRLPGREARRVLARRRPCTCRGRTRGRRWSLVTDWPGDDDQRRLGLVARLIEDPDDRQRWFRRARVPAESSRRRGGAGALVVGQRPRLAAPRAALIDRGFGAAGAATRRPLARYATPAVRPRISFSIRTNFGSSASSANSTFGASYAKFASDGLRPLNRKSHTV